MFYPCVWSYIEASDSTRVLLAEADDELRHYFATGLRRQGLAVLAAPDGAEVRSILAAIGRGDLPRPGAVIVDLQLRGYSGLDLLPLVRASCGPVPVILTSALLYRDVRRAEGELHVIACLMKPLSAARLSRAIRDAVDEALRPSRV